MDKTKGLKAPLMTKSSRARFSNYLELQKKLKKTLLDLLHLLHLLNLLHLPLTFIIS